MSHESFMKKYSLLAITIGVILAVSVLIVGFNLLNTPNTDESQNGGGIGAKIALRMEETHENISSVWIYNNTFANLDLSNLYGKFIDGIAIGSIDSVLKMVLIHEPTADIADISQQDLNSVMANFRSAISEVDDPSETYNNIDQIFPPSFICDIGYEDHTSLSLVFSSEFKVLGILNGTWQASGHSHHGIDLAIMDYNLGDAVFLEFTDMQKMIAAIQSFEAFILQTFPLP